MNFLLRTRIGSKIVTGSFRTLVRLFVFSTKFGKQTYRKKTVQAVWKAAHKK
jgi:hypothetical protein